MGVPCRLGSSDKKFSTSFDQNIMKKAKEHGFKDKLNMISFNSFYRHVIRTGELYFKGDSLKTIRWPLINHKHFKVIPTFVVFEPDEVYNIFVNIDKNLQKHL